MSPWLLLVKALSEFWKRRDAYMVLLGCQFGVMPGNLATFKITIRTPHMPNTRAIAVAHPLMLYFVRGQYLMQSKDLMQRQMYATCSLLARDTPLVNSSTRLRSHGVTSLPRLLMPISSASAMAWFTACSIF